VIALAGRLVLLVLLALLLGGCGRSTRPDFSRLYADTGSDQPPVVVIHGVLGARLADDRGRERWPGGLGRLALSDYADLALSIDPESLRPRDDGLRPAGIFESEGGRDFYGKMLRTLEEGGSYTRAFAGLPPPARRHYYVFTYDWRMDNVDSVRKLDAMLAQIRRDHRNPSLKVDLVAHSNGGLIARYYARFGTADLLDGNDFPVTQAGARQIRRLILLGTPNFGSVDALRSLIEGKRVGLRKIPPEVLMTMPSIFQLLPHALNDWLLGHSGRPLRRDVFDVTIWRRFEWAIFDPVVRERIRQQYVDGDPEQHLAEMERYFAHHLERARRFSWALSVPEPKAGIRPIIFGGDCELTTARLLVEEKDGDSVLRLHPDDIERPLPGIDYHRLMLEPGDGTVTKASLLAREALDPSRQRHAYSHFPNDYSFFLCVAHDQLTGNASFQDNLLHALLSVDR
jgi:pimeloyl-ACP methyl ester carboxylesterase